MQLPGFDIRFRLPLVIIVCIAVLTLATPSANADCNSDVAAFNALIERTNAIQANLSCANAGELPPLYAQAIAIDERIFGNKCPLTKVGSKPEDLRVSVRRNEKIIADCQARTAKLGTEFHNARRVEDERRRQALPPSERPYDKPMGGWRGTSDPADCANANSVARSSAAWGTMCARGANPQPAAQQTIKPVAPTGSRPVDPIRILAEQIGDNLAQQLPPADASTGRSASPSVALAPAAPSGAPRSTSGASQAPQSPKGTSIDGICYGGPLAPPSGGPYDCKPHWQGTSDAADCANANSVERSSAYWGLMCVPEKPEDVAERNRERYYNKSPVKPDDLAKRADVACSPAQPARARQACIESFKLQFLLSNDPVVRAECAATADHKRQLVCAHVVYTYGRGANENLKLVLRVSLGGSDPDPGTPWRAPPKPQEAVDGCSLGKGLKPTPGAFGAWSCQPLGLDADTSQPQPVRDQMALATDAPDPIGAFEDDISEMAALATAGADRAEGARLSAQDRERCAKETYATARALFKGGAAPNSPTCHDIAKAALRELPVVGNGSVRTYDRAVLGVLQDYLNMRNANSGRTNTGDLGRPPPGMNGLEPSAEERRQADCIARGGTSEDCLKPPQASPPPATTKAPPLRPECAFAETHWRTAEDIKTLAIYQDHLVHFPTCQFATLAKARIAALQRR